MSKYITPDRRGGAGESTLTIHHQSGLNSCQFSLTFYCVGLKINTLLCLQKDKVQFVQSQLLLYKQCFSFFCSMFRILPDFGFSFNFTSIFFCELKVVVSHLEWTHPESWHESNRKSVIKIGVMKEMDFLTKDKFSQYQNIQKHL